MPINILMPALSPTMEKGNLAKWLKKEGDAVKSGDVIAEIETDKATMEVEAVDDGTLAKIVVPEGTQDVAVNDIIAVLAGEGEDVKAAGAGAGAAKPAAAASPSPQPAPAGRGGGRRRNRRLHPSCTRRRSTARRRRHLRSMVRAARASSPRRWRGGWRRTPGSISAVSMVRARMAASSPAMSRVRNPARA